VQSTFPFNVEPRWRSTHKPLHIVKKARRAVFACFSKSKNRTALRIVVSVRAYRAHQHARVPAHAYSRVHSFRIMHGFLRVYMVYAFDRLSPICSHQRRVIALFALRQKKKEKMRKKEREREIRACVFRRRYSGTESAIFYLRSLTRQFSQISSRLSARLTCRAFSKCVFAQDI